MHFCLALELRYCINYDTNIVLYRLHFTCDIGKPYTFAVPYLLILFTFVSKRVIKESQKNSKHVIKMDYNTKTCLLLQTTFHLIEPIERLMF